MYDFEYEKDKDYRNYIVIIEGIGFYFSLYFLSYYSFSYSNLYSSYYSSYSLKFI